jgi:hypothetical protein
MFRMKLLYLWLAGAGALTLGFLVPVAGSAQTPVGPGIGRTPLPTPRPGGGVPPIATLPSGGLGGSRPALGTSTPTGGGFGGGSGVILLTPIPAFGGSAAAPAAAPTVAIRGPTLVPIPTALVDIGGRTAPISPALELPNPLPTPSGSSSAGHLPAAIAQPTSARPSIEGDTSGSLGPSTGQATPVGARPATTGPPLGQIGAGAPTIQAVPPGAGGAPAAGGTPGTGRLGQIEGQPALGGQSGGTSPSGSPPGAAPSSGGTGSQATIPGAGQSGSASTGGSGASGVAARQVTTLPASGGPDPLAALAGLAALLAGGISLRYFASRRARR